MLTLLLMEKVPNNFFSFWSFLFVSVLLKCPDLIYFLEVTLKAVEFLDQLLGATHTPNTFLAAFRYYFFFPEFFHFFRQKRKKKCKKVFLVTKEGLTWPQPLVHPFHNPLSKIIHIINIYTFYIIQTKIAKSKI